MPCYTTLPLTSAVEEFTPLHSAVYVPSTGMILGAMSNFILEFNATTGENTRAVKALSPMIGPMHLSMVGAVPYLSAHFDPSAQDADQGDVTHSRCDIFPLSATTLLPGTGLGTYAKYIATGTPKDDYYAHQFVSLGTRAYFLYPDRDNVHVGYIGLANPADSNDNDASGKFWSEQLCTDGTYIYTADPYWPQIRQYDADLSLVDGSDTTGYYPVGVEWATGVGAHAVCGDKWLIRVDDFATSANTFIDLEASIASVVTGIKPIRLRYRSTDAKLYIPVQNKDGILVYDPASGIGAWKSGFDSPVDVVFTPSKAFAVQSGLVGLKEIV